MANPKPSRFDLSLPIGLHIDGRRETSFSVRKTDRHFDAVFTNDTMMAKQPQRWLALLVSCALDTLAGVSIRDQLTKDNFLKIPEIVLDLTPQDTSYILLCAHINTFGGLVDDIAQKCVCTFENRFRVDLESDQEVSILRPDPPPTGVVCTIPDGWQRTVETGKKHGTLGYEGVIFNQFHFDLPRLRHALSQEKFFKRHEMAEFNLRVAQQALQRVCSVNPERPDDILAELPKEDLDMYRSVIILEGLFGRDKREIRDAFAKLEVVKTKVTRSCDKCGGDLSVYVGTNDLFPLASSAS